MGELSPTSADNLEPSVSVWGIKFQFCRELTGTPPIESDSPDCKISEQRSPDLGEKQNLNRCAGTIPPRAGDAIFIRDST